MKKLKLIMLFCIGALFIAGNSFGQANPFINVLPSNSGIVAVGDTIDIEVTIGNTGPISTVPQAKLRPIIQVPPSVTFLPSAQQVGLPAGWTILSNTGTQLRVCNSTDPIPVSTSRTIILKAQGVTVTGPQTFSGNINFGNGTTCAAGTSVAGDLTTDNSATSTVQVVAPAVTLNLNVFIEGYWDGTSAMIPALQNQGQPNTATQCDSITVALISTATVLAGSPYTPDYTTTTVLNTNGTASAVFANAVSGNYYIAVKHRNAVETWSANPVAITSTPVTYDFTTAANKAFGDNQVQVATGVWAFYSGDIVKDFAESIDLIDLGQVEGEISNFSFGYFAEDLNGDGNVDILDTPKVEDNINNFIFSTKP
jgi:hypothetical protein